LSLERRRVMRSYVLDTDGKTPIKSTGWGAGADSLGKRVALDELSGGSVVVSTVFLGIDHSWEEEGPPILWETMIFGGPLNDYQVRYSSHDDAVKGHQEAVTLARLAGKQEQG
jgi:hypothetical protein